MRILLLAGAFLLMLACGRTRVSQTNVAGPSGSLHVDDGGKPSKDPPVVFLHSFAGDSGQWKAQLAHLRAHRRALAMDLRAHGQSEAPRDGKHSVEAMVEDLEAVVAARKLDRFVLVGHSMGGAVAVVYAGKHPDKVAGLVLVGTPGRAPAELKSQVLQALETDRRDQVLDQYWDKLLTNATPKTREIVEAGRKQMGNDRSVSFIEAIFDYDPVPSLRRYDGPVMAIVSDGDDANPAALHKTMPMERRPIEGTSHWVQLDRPDAFNKVLDDFLSGAGTRIGS